MSEYIVEKKQTSGGWTWAEPKGELIMCKDCKYWHHNYLPIGNRRGCDKLSDYTPEDGYCFMAERKEE